jgi:hypothetical protein
LEVSGQLHAPAALPLGKKLAVPTGQETGWAPEQFWTTWRGENSCPYRDLNSDPSAFQPVAIPTVVSRFHIRDIKKLIASVLMGIMLDFNLE